MITDAAIAQTLDKQGKTLEKQKHVAKINNLFLASNIIQTNDYFLFLQEQSQTKLLRKRFSFQ